MAEFYSETQRSLQDRFGTRGLANVLEERVLRKRLTERDQKFLAACDFFFLTTVDDRGYPTVSYKGGGPGFVRILDDRTLAFPVYDGNGMFLSTGNVASNAKVGLLFIDFERPRRLRLHGEARLLPADPMMADYPEALFMIRVALTEIFTNCPRYIHHYKRLDVSEYVPRAGCETPVPEWKRVDYLQAQLPEKDRLKAQKAGETITEDVYRKNFWKGVD